MLNLASTLILTALVGVQGSNSGCQMQGMHSGSMHMGQGFHRIVRVLHSEHLAGMLELTEDQASDLSDLKYSHEEKVLDIKQEIERERLALSQLMEADEMDRRAIETRIKNIASLRTDLELEKIDLVFSINEILSDEQIQMLQSSGMSGGCIGSGSGHGMGGMGN